MNIDEQKVRDIFKEEITKYANNNAFGVSVIPAHAHNGSDSLRVDANDMEYGVPYLVIFNSTTTPTAKVTGAIASVNGILEIYNGTSWVKVSTQ